MNKQIHELSHGDLESVSGGLRDTLIQQAPPTAPIVVPPPLGHGPVVPPSSGPFHVNSTVGFER